MRTERHVLDGLSLVACVLLLASPAFGVTYVDARAPGDKDGSSWENAYVSLQSALGRIRGPGSEIWIAQGTYRPDQRMASTRTHPPGGSLRLIVSGDRNDTFDIPGGTVLKGGYAGYGAPDPNERDIEAYETILSGDLRGNDVDLTDRGWQGLLEYVTHPSLEDNSLTVVTMDDEQDSSTVLDGLTITGGFADGGSEGQPNTGDVPAALWHTDGAGAFIANATPTIIRCTFYHNVTRSALQGAAGGAGVACTGSGTSPTFRECSFQENIVFGQGAGAYGAGVLIYASDPNFFDCTFTNNMVAGLDAPSGGGALANFRGWQPQLTSCRFAGNVALKSRGGAVFTGAESLTAFTRCTFEGNSADFGGAAYDEGKSGMGFIDCLFLHNEAVNSGHGGAVFHSGASVTARTCCFVGNTAAGQGGAIGGDDIAYIDFCLFNGNSARLGGAIFSDQDGDLRLIGSTLAGNRATEHGGGVYADNDRTTITNCILWDDTPNEIYLLNRTALIGFNNVQGGWTGHNINADPQFADALGPDGVAGTMDDNLRLTLGSPCLDVGDDTNVAELWMTDLDGNLRIAGAHVDMGAYEFHGPFNYYVDAVNGDDASSGGTPTRAFATIQSGIDAAQEGYSVVVLPGLYTEEVDFRGKAITLMGSGGAPVLEAPGDYAVSFYSAEGPASVLKNFVIENSDVGIFIAGSSPTIRNVTLANNEFGIAAYAGAHPDVSNCILWNNIDGDLFGCTARFSCVEQGAEGQGNISADPLFADAAGGDYHLHSEWGRYVPAYGLWSFDTVTSPCVDAGDPTDALGAERMPNGGRINMGAYGGTPEASMSEWPLVADINRDGIVDLKDLAIVFDQWLMRLPGGPSAPAADTMPPLPDPAQWDPNGLPREFYGGGGGFDYWVEMKAMEAFDPSGPVEYFFECLQYPGAFPDGLSSGWQVDLTYTVLAGRQNQGFQFRVKARDRYGNETAWSLVVQASSGPGQPPQRR